MPQLQDLNERGIADDLRGKHVKVCEEFALAQTGCMTGTSDGFGGANSRTYR